MPCHLPSVRVTQAKSPSKAFGGQDKQTKEFYQMCLHAIPDLSPTWFGVPPDTAASVATNSHGLQRLYSGSKDGF